MYKVVGCLAVRTSKARASVRALGSKYSAATAGVAPRRAFLHLVAQSLEDVLVDVDVAPAVGHRNVAVWKEAKTV